MLDAHCMATKGYDAEAETHQHGLDIANPASLRGCKTAAEPGIQLVTEVCDLEINDSWLRSKLL